METKRKAGITWASAFKRLFWATTGLFLVAVATIVFVFIDSGRKQESLRSQQQAFASQQRFIRAQQVELEALTARLNGTLCDWRGELKRRVANSERYLRETPNAIPGITPAQIRKENVNLHHTIEKFGRLDCSKPHGVPR